MDGFSVVMAGSPERAASLTSGPRRRNPVLRDTKPGFWRFSCSHFIRFSAATICLRNRHFHFLQLFLGGVHIVAQRIIFHDARVGIAFLLAEARTQVRIALPHVPQRLVGLAEKWILLHQMIQPVHRRRVVAALEVERSHLVLAIGQRFLNLPEKLLGFGNEGAVRKLNDQLPAFVFGPDGLARIAIRLLHLPNVNLADFLLRFGGFLHGGIEEDKVLVLGFGLSQTRRSALAIPTVGDRQLSFRQKLALIVGIDERVQSNPRDFKTAVFDVVDGFVEQHLVGLLGVLGDRVVVLLAAETARRNQPCHQCHKQNVSSHSNQPTSLN